MSRDPRLLLTHCPDILNIRFRSQHPGWLSQLQASYPPCSQRERRGDHFSLRALPGGHVPHFPLAKTQPCGHIQLQERLRIVVGSRWSCLQPKCGDFIMKGKRWGRGIGEQTLVSASQVLGELFSRTWGGRGVIRVTGMSWQVSATKDK